MMKLMIIRFLGFLFIFISIAGQGQVISSFDRGVGESRIHPTGVTILMLIEKNQPNEILHYLSDDYKIDLLELQNQCEYVSNRFPLEKGIYPMYFLINSSSDLSYERTYVKKNKGYVKYLYQIFIELKQENGEVVVTKIEFRNKKDVEKRRREAKVLINKNAKFPPAPPPPPPLKKNDYI